jgi:hypothetical protein
MSERVTLSYSVDLRDLEDEVGRLYSRAVSSLGEYHRKLINETPHNTLTSDTYERIDGIRRELSDLDIKLQDINSIINSYLLYQAQLNAQNHVSAETQDENAN